VTHYTIDRHQPARLESSKVNAPCHIPTVVSVITDELGLSTWRAVHPLPPSTYPNWLDYGFQTDLIAASKLAQSRPPSVTLNSLDYSLQVHLHARLITTSKCISKNVPSRPLSASPYLLDCSLEVYLQNSPITAPSVHDNGLQVRLYFLSITVSRASPNSLDHGLEVYV
jgi:hypothetical protein